ncbi:hypothetical protein HBI56_200180 [Parastagonospora nodorum]|uniref:Uncharacterized protein n=1 Tax=Phaeosphaeria nodorum (strain SN15 / ATCC MYA-4574 / FGSC 10173) TaxID=321614 RepID=A0A7U2EW00_PHANO|nr:hypothetical protein HBH56_214720 [Parastagonospora nodorum]QRC93786.1 hypothetical protein JI435_156960 [Parastagonospora nodorum SN15]KAH3922566.1 hypothetical protein HBH54_222780 [Parastagonospora nodorum]KAH3942163.1 hypothetical protein HBH53_192690 [Parastagonospora nodorum]KAH3961377.1 hypothetical protein HBH51_183410 [Parastagonospora nodorum]
MFVAQERFARRMHAARDLQDATVGRSEARQNIALMHGSLGFRGYDAVELVWCCTPNQCTGHKTTPSRTGNHRDTVATLSSSRGTPGQ